MKQKGDLKMAKALKVSGLVVGLIFGILIFIFALLSGSEEYGNDFWSLLKNSPNALPWLLFLLIIWLAWKQELMGGLTLIGLGISLLFLFNTFRDFQWPSFIVSLIVIFNGYLFVHSWWLLKDFEPE